MERKSHIIVISRSERILIGRRRKIITHRPRRLPMRCEWCNGRMFIDGFPCTHCLGGETNCCDGGPGAVYGSDAQIQEGQLALRLEGGSNCQKQKASDSDNALREESGTRGEEGIPT